MLDDPLTAPRISNRNGAKLTHLLDADPAHGNYSPRLVLSPSEPIDTGFIFDEGTVVDADVKHKANKLKLRAMG